MRKEDVLKLWLMPGIGPVTLRKIAGRFSSVDELFSKSSNLNQSSTWGNVTREEVEKLFEEEIISMQKASIQYISYLCPEYPEALKQIYNAPAVLFYLGDPTSLSRFTNIGIVGTRKNSKISADFTSFTVKTLATETTGFCIVSGLAYGIDTIAHREAVLNKIPTVGVLANGLAKIYPLSNTSLALEIINSGGCLISEYPSSYKPLPGNFPLRNRLISGLSRAVIIAEAGERSGALITARYALEQNRDVYAIPGNWNDQAFAGNNSLIREAKAKLLTHPREILQDFGISNTAVSLPLENKSTVDQTVEALLSELSGDEKSIATSMKNGKKHEEEIQAITGLSTQNVLANLTMLEMKGLANPEDGGFWTLNSSRI